jgi:short subunit dehydrogenase-like uncharacterized protein
MPLVSVAAKALAWGPSDAERARARCAVVAQARSGNGKTATAWVTTGDGYDFTAVSAVECAVRAAADGFDQRGVLTPTQAFGARPLLDALAAHDVRYG